MSSCCAFLPRDPVKAASVIRNLLATALAGDFAVQTVRGRRVAKLDEIVGCTTRQLQHLKATGALPAGDPDRVVFEEVCVSEPEGSTIDVIAHVAPDTKLILRVHHGKGNSVTYHLPSVRASYGRLHGADSAVGLAHDAVVNTLVVVKRRKRD